MFAQMQSQISIMTQNGNFSGEQAGQIQQAFANLQILAGSELFKRIVQDATGLADAYIVANRAQMSLELGNLRDGIEQVGNLSSPERIRAVLAPQIAPPTDIGALAVNLGEIISQSKTNGATFQTDLYIQNVKSSLWKMGFGLFGSRYEVGIVPHAQPNGSVAYEKQHELALSHQGANGLLPPHVAFTRLKEISPLISQRAGEVGLNVNFSPQPTLKHKSSGIHVHFGLSHIQTGKTLFTIDPVSSEAKDVLRYVELGVASVVGDGIYACAPSDAAYERYRSNSFAPSSVNPLGEQKQQNAIRRIANGGTECHLELRIPSSDADPYMVGASLMGGVLYGLHS
jgi:hypothetical protein